MKNLQSFRSGYIIIIPIIAFIGIGIASLLLRKSILTINEFIQLLVAIVALVISLIAIAISDKKTPKLDFKVTLWANVGHIKGRNTASIHYKVLIKLENKSKFPLVNP